MSRPDTKAIRALADACFRAPWTATTFTVECDRHDYEECPGEGEHEAERIESPDEYPAYPDSPQVVADVPGMEMFSKPHAAFIAAARTDVPALCDRVEALEAALADALSLYTERESEDAYQRYRAACDILEGK